MDEEDFQKYLHQLQDKFSRFHLKSVRNIWAMIQFEDKRIPLPIATPTYDHGLQLSWTKNKKHISIDIYEDTADWFFKNRENGDIDGGDFVNINVLPQKFISKLRLLNDER